LGFTVLHLASFWAPGLSILLGAGAITFIDERCDNRSTPRSVTALDLAIKFDAIDSVTVLLEHGAFWGYFNLLDGDPTSVRCVELLAHHVAMRRKQLYILAKQHLSPCLLESLDFPQCGFPDSQAQTIIRQIMAKGVSVPKFLHVPMGYQGIFVSGNLSYAHFPIFYNAGFIEIAGRNADGLPLVYYSNFGELEYTHCHINGRMAVFGEDTLQWLQDHQCLDQCPKYPHDADMHRINTSATGWHIIAARAGVDMFPLRPLFGHLTTMISAINITDRCSCPCTMNGCSPFITYCKIFTCEVDKAERWKVRRGVRVYRQLWDAAQTRADEFIRYITFEALEMTHTCCVACRFRR